MTPNSKQRPQFKRSKDGCLTCRQRKKKCSEVRPRCAGCARNNLDCRWLDPPQPQVLSQAEGLLHQGGSAADDDVHLGPAPSGGPVTERMETVPAPAPETAVWVPQFQCYTTSPRPLFLTPISQKLLQHYVSSTGALLPMPMTDNIFVTVLLPLACMDDMLMHSLVALGGVHLSCIDKNGAEVNTSMLRHYIFTIQQLRTQLGDIDTCDTVRTTRLLLVLMILCHVEIISGQSNGTLFQHLNASMQLIKRVIENNGDSRPSNWREVGVVLELYSFMAISNILTPEGLLEVRTVPIDDICLIMGMLGEFETRGIMFAGFHDLFALIPLASRLFAHRLAEEAAGVSRPSQKIIQESKALMDKLQEWELEDKPFRFSEAAKTRDQSMSAEGLRHAVRIYILAATDGSRLEPATRRKIDDSTDSIIGLYRAVTDISWLCNSLWAFLVAGSCLVEGNRQATLADDLRNTVYNMDHILRGVDLLENLWRDPDPLCFGPYGLFLTIRRHNPSFCII